MRRCFSRKDELVRKSREAMLAAVQIYNNPNITFKAESFITLAVVAWTYLMHAYYREKEIDARYYSFHGKRKRYDKTKYGAFKRWELERCINTDMCPLDNGTQANLRFLIGVRHEIEHQMTDKIDEYISAKLQACAINYDHYIIEFFGAKYGISSELALAIQFSPLSPDQRDALSDNNHIETNIKNFICDFEDSLSEDTVRNTRYAYRVLFVPVLAKRKNQADKVVDFVSPGSEMADEIEKIYIKETEKPKYLPKQIVGAMQKKGYAKFIMNRHTELWKNKDAKGNAKYGVFIANTWYWYQSWFDEVEKYCIDHREELK